MGTHFLTGAQANTKVGGGGSGNTYQTYNNLKSISGINTSKLEEFLTSIGKTTTNGTGVYIPDDYVQIEETFNIKELYFKVEYNTLTVTLIFDKKPSSYWTSYNSETPNLQWSLKYGSTNWQGYTGGNLSGNGAAWNSQNSGIWVAQYTASNIAGFLTSFSGIMGNESTLTITSETLGGYKLTGVKTAKYFVNYIYEVTSSVTVNSYVPINIYGNSDADNLFYTVTSSDLSSNKIDVDIKTGKKFTSLLFVSPSTVRKNTVTPSWSGQVGTCSLTSLPLASGSGSGSSTTPSSGSGTTYTYNITINTSKTGHYGIWSNGPSTTGLVSGSNKSITITSSTKVTSISWGFTTSSSSYGWDKTGSATVSWSGNTGSASFTIS